jgi:hypothetical protein
MIPIAEATDAAIRHALTRHWLAGLAAHRPPHEQADADAVRVAGELARVLAVLDLLRDTHRDVRGLQRGAVVLAARLAELGLSLPGVNAGNHGGPRGNPQRPRCRP